MNVIIRADASTVIGTGHVMRCLTLADYLRTIGAETSFICRKDTGSLIPLIEKRGYSVHSLPADISSSLDQEMSRGVIESTGRRYDWLIIDHYALDKRWETPMRPFTKKIMVIDDMADRPHDCDLLLDQNLHVNTETRYDDLVPLHCRKLLGPSYALLRPEFIEVRKTMRHRDGSIRRILIFFGGSDPTNETAKALEAVSMLNRPDIAIDVVTGTANPNREQIRRQCSLMPNTAFHCQIENMAQLMAIADFSIGAGGSTTWERCYLGLPTLIVIIAHNQAELVYASAALGAVWNLGWNHSVNAQTIQEALKSALNDPVQVRHLSEKAYEIMAGSSRDLTFKVLSELEHVSS